MADFPAERIERAGGPPHSPCAESTLSIAMAKNLPGPGTYAMGDDWRPLPGGESEPYEILGTIAGSFDVVILDVGRSPTATTGW